MATQVQTLAQVKPFDTPLAQDQVSILQTPVWKFLSQLPPRDDDCSYWWQTTGPRLATLLLEAGYTVQQQYEGLLFHYLYVVPRLGQKPTTDTPPQWKSFMTDDFSPIEYSWKWDQDGSFPDVRYGVEPIGPYAGTFLDPHNQAAMKEVLYQLGKDISSLNLSLFYHFSETLFSDEVRRTITNGSATQDGSSMFLAFELLKNELAAKAYFVPPRSETPTKDTICDAIRSIAMDGLDFSALETMADFMNNDPTGTKLEAFMLGIDCVDPLQSRLKVYVRSPDTSFDSVCQVVTMGGRRPVSQHDLSEMRELWRLTLGLDANFASADELPTKTHLTSGICYYFDIKPNTTVPDIKAYIPVRHYAQSDLQIAEGLIEFLEQRGRAHFAENYMRSLKEICDHHPLDSGTGVQTYISCAFTKGGLSMTSYLSPEIYHPDRWSK